MYIMPKIPYMTFKFPLYFPKFCFNLQSIEILIYKYKQ